uniref:Annexin n=1 Tax=Poecilia formosa TaxID=48698 RepID=A0A087YCH2_POEFO
MSFIQAFLQQTVYLGLPDESLLKNEGTVTAAPNFNPSADAGVLEKAIKTKVHVTFKQFTIQFDLVLINRFLNLKLFFYFNVSNALCILDAKSSKNKEHDVSLQLHESNHYLNQSHTAGVDEHTIIDVLVKRSNDQRQHIKEAYQQAKWFLMYMDMLSANKLSEYSACLRLITQAGRTEGVNEQLIDSDARTLYEAGEGRKGKDCSAFIEILTTRSAPHLRKVFDRYSKYSKVDMAKAIDLELKGDIESCLTAIVKCAGSRPAFFAEKLYLAMKGKGTRKHILTRIMVSRSEIDMKRIKDEYKKNYGKTLYQDILDDTKGDYEKILLALCGEN